MSQSDGWDPTREVYLGALRRLSAGDRIRWFTAPNPFTSHVMNAYEEGSRIHFDVRLARQPVSVFRLQP
jgi:carotenoid cleavage dioxygenase-like enzyme